MFEIEEAVASILKRNGFRVVRYFRCPLGWIDVVGFRRGFSVGVEVGKPEFVASKFDCCSFDVKVVISDEGGGKEGVIVVSDLREFCNKLGLKCPEIAEMVEKIDRAREGEGSKLYERALDYLERSLGDRAVARRAIDGVVYLYMAGEVVEDYSGRVTERIPFVKLFPILVESGLAIRDTKEITRPQTYLTSLTRMGVKLAKFALSKKLEELGEVIERLMEDVGRWIVKIATVGLMERRGLRLEKRKIDAVDLSGSFDEVFYSISPVLSKIPSYELIKLLRGCNGTICAFFRVLCYTVLYPKVEELFERLFEMGLASKVPVYDYYGEFFGYEYRTSKEVANILSKISYVEVDGRILEEFESVLNAMMLRRSRDLEMAIEKGIVKEKEGGFEVLDERRFEDFVKTRLARVIAEYLSSISSSRAP